MHKIFQDIVVRNVCMIFGEFKPRQIPKNLSKGALGQKGHFLVKNANMKTRRKVNIDIVP